MARWTLGPELVLVISIYHSKVDTRPRMGSSYYREPLLETPCAAVHDSLSLISPWDMGYHFLSFFLFSWTMIHPFFFSIDLD
jgi:hypothetical protein